MSRERAIAAGVGLLLLGVGFGLGWLARGMGGSAAREEADFLASADPASDDSRSISAALDGGAARDTTARGAAVSDAGTELPSGRTGDVAVVGTSESARGVDRASAAAPSQNVGPIPPAGDGGAPTGRLAASVIRDEVRSHREELGFCFAWQLHQHPELRGRLTMDFTIGADGRVVRAEVAEDELGDETVARCFRGVTERMRFPAPEGGTVQVRYPFVLSPDAPVPEGRR